MKRSTLFKKPTINIDQVKPDGTLYFDDISSGYLSNHFSESGGSWERRQSYLGDDFIVLMGEFFGVNDSLTYTLQQGYIKFQFRLTGNNTVILQGLGEFEVDQPQLLITAGPDEIVKADFLKGGARYSHVSLCIKPNFFLAHLGLDVEELPSPLSALFSGNVLARAAYQITIGAPLQAALHTLLIASSSTRLAASYFQAKAVELMCLLLSQLEGIDKHTDAQKNLSKVKVGRLYEVREMLMLDYAKENTLAQIAKAAGFSKTALTMDFRQLFGLSVYDFIQQQRMLKAMELLKDPQYSIAQIAEAVGYKQSCNFSTAFRNYFGNPPKTLQSLARRSS